MTPSCLSRPRGAKAVGVVGVDRSADSIRAGSARSAPSTRLSRSTTASRGSPLASDKTRGSKNVPSALPSDGSSSPPGLFGGLADAARRLARTAQGGLPVVGLLSRLAAPGGGVGWDELAYPEFARALVDADASGDVDGASASYRKGSFADAVSSWHGRHGMNGQARYVNLYLWMAFSGGGALVPSRVVATSARRLAVTQDIEIEVERFDQARAAALKDLKFGPRPRADAADQVALAVDALARVSCGLADGAPLNDEDASLLERIIPPALAVARRYSSVSEGSNASPGSAEDAVALVRKAVASRGERAKAYE